MKKRIPTLHVEQVCDTPRKSAVYLTIYKGNKLPPFYIGSAFLDKIEHEGYLGSVTSREYKAIWKQEIKKNRHLFSIKIIAIFDDRQEATNKEAELQRKLKVIKNSLYTNKSIAAKNGFFGRFVEKKFHPMHIKGGHSEESKLKMAASQNERLLIPENLLKAQEHMREVSRLCAGNPRGPRPYWLKTLLSELKMGVPLSEEHCKSISEGVTKALAKPEVRAKLGKHMIGKKDSPERNAKRCKPCTIDGITIYASKKDLAKALGCGKAGCSNPNLQYVEKK